MSHACRTVVVLLCGAVVAAGWSQCSFGQEPEQAATPELPPTPPEPSPLLVEPTTPEEMFAAAVLMVDLARPSLARQYLEQFLATNPDDQLLLALRRRHGTPAFLRLANVPELQPLSTQLLERVTAAVNRQVENPEYVDELVNQYLTGSPTRRSAALLELRNAGARVVPQIVRRLTTAEQPERDNLLNVLIQIGRPVVPPLLGALESPDPELRANVLTVLGWLGDQEVLPFLYAQAFSPEQPPGVQVAARRALARIVFGDVKAVHRVSEFGAADELIRIAREFYRGERPVPLEADGTAIVWRWSPELGTVFACVMSPQGAALYRGLQFSRQAVGMVPTNLEAQKLLLGLALASEVQAVNWRTPLPAGPETAYHTALLSGAELVTAVLRDALAAGRADTAVAALQVLGQIATRSQVLLDPVQPSPILNALNYPDQRVQFAAAGTILQLDPIRPFSGSGRVVEILTRAVSDGDMAKAVIADPDPAHASLTAGALSRVGYDPLIVSTGKAAFAAAAENAGVEVIVLQANVSRWGLSQTIANLRADARTAMIPVVIYGPDNLGATLGSLAQRTERAVFIAEPMGDEGFEIQLRPVLARLSSPPLTAEERAAQQSAAVYWLAHIANGQRTEIFDLTPAEVPLFRVARDPQLAGNAVSALGGIATPSAQVRLSELALNSMLPPEIRETAALQLAFHIQRFGLLLSDSQLRETRTAWESADNPRLATAFAAVFGSLQPNPRLVGERLRQMPLTVPQPQPQP